MNLLPQQAHLLWLIAALALAACELLTGGFVLLWFGCGCVFAAIAAWFGASLEAQLVVLGLSAIALFAMSRTIFRHIFMAGAPGVRTNVSAMIGQSAEVIDAKSVRVNGEIWNAVGAESLQPGTPVVIEHVEGLKLRVRQVI